MNGSVYLMEKRSETFIICTIGPSSSSLEIIEEMFLKGASVIRLNMSHGNKSDHEKVIDRVRAIEKKYNQKIFIALDTKGPETRISCKTSLNVKINDLIELYTLNDYKFVGQEKLAIGINVPCLDFVKVGDKINIDDSKLTLMISEIQPGKIIAKSEGSHILETGKRIHFPRKSKKSIFLTEEDKIDLDFALKKKLDALFLSFVETKEDLFEIREYLGESEICLFSKIESNTALNNLNEIVKYTDGLMIARGDLMNDVGVEKLFSAQKLISSFGERIPVIMATEMLQSMVSSSIPYRAEISDIGNAVLDGCCAVMLSAESAIGKHPGQCVDTLRKISIDAEEYCKLKGIERSKVQMFKSKKRKV